MVNAKYSSAILPPPRAQASAAADGGSVPGETTVIYVRRHRRQTELEAEFDAILSDRSVPLARGTASRRTYMRHMYARRYLFPQFIYRRFMGVANFYDYVAKVLGQLATDYRSISIILL